MPDLKEMAERRDAVAAEGNEILAAAKEKNQPLSDEDSQKLRSLSEEFLSLDQSITKATADRDEQAEIAARFAAAAEAKVRSDQDEVRTRSEQRPALYGSGGDDLADLLTTPGEQFVQSDAYRTWIGKHPAGGPTSEGMTGRSPAMPWGSMRAMLGLTDATTVLRGALTKDRYRALVTSDSGSAGTLVNSLRRGLLEPGLVRPLTVRDLVTVIPVTTDTIEYVKEASRISNAAPVADATALTGTSGLKPEGGLTFEKVTDYVRTIAEWVPVTNRIIKDAPQLRNYIDGYLQYDLALELEDQMISGSGGGEDFDGILNVADTQTQTGADTMLDDLRQAKRKVRTGARTNATAIVMSPEDVAEMDTLKAHNTADTAGSYAYLGSNPFQYDGNPRVWGLPIVESEAVDAGTAIVGDFRRAVLFDREETNISVGTADDDFIRNIVRVLAELRAGFGVIRPAAFVIVTF